MFGATRSGDRLLHRILDAIPATHDGGLSNPFHASRHQKLVASPHHHRQTPQRTSMISIGNAGEPTGRGSPNSHLWDDFGTISKSRNPRRARHGTSGAIANSTAKVRPAHSTDSRQTLPSHALDAPRPGSAPQADSPRHATPIDFESHPPHRAAPLAGSSDDLPSTAKTRRFHQQSLI